MAISVKPLAQSTERWERRSAAAASDYVAGTENPKRPWMESTLAGEANYKAAVVAAANSGRQGAGVRKAGNAKWARNIQRKGAANFQTGIMGAGADWAAGTEPYQKAVAAVVLPARGPKNSPANYQRSQLVGDTQAKLRASLLQR